MDHLKNPEAKVLMVERFICAEGVLGEAKVLHGLNRATCRGLDKVTIQAVLTAAVQNLKRLVRSKSGFLTEKIGKARQYPSQFQFLLGFKNSWATAP